MTVFVTLRHLKSEQNSQLLICLHDVLSLVLFSTLDQLIICLYSIRLITNILYFKYV